MRSGLSDPILRDIRHATKIGYYDRLKEDGPSRMMLMSVWELLKNVSTMSPERRRLYLGSLGKMWGERAGLSVERRSRKAGLWLSRAGMRL